MRVLFGIMGNYYLKKEDSMRNTIEFQIENFAYPSKFEKDTIDMWKGTTQGKIAESFINDYGTGQCLFFNSDKSGSGKTSLAISIAKKLIELGRTKYNCHFYIADDLFEELREATLQGINLKSTPIFRNMMRSDLIIIDDLGVEKVTKFIAQRYFYLMNAFWNEGKSVIITSKFNLINCLYRAEPDVDDEMLTSLASRMRDMFIEVEFSQVDHRCK